MDDKNRRSPVQPGSIRPPADDRGVRLIAAERQRQITAEGWSAEHDFIEHDGQQLAWAALSYLREAIELNGVDDWPWDTQWWKPSDDPIRNLVKAGALIAAEIDRLQRAKGQPDG